MNILWTLDPFQENKELVLVGKSILNRYFKNDNIEAVYVASRAENELNYAFDIDEKIRYSEYPKSLMAKELKKLNMPNVKPHVISSNTLSLSSIIKEMAGYSEKKKNDLILIASNAKATLPRLILGSFAESLIHQSKTDLLVFNQKSIIGEKSPSHIVVGHDFSARGNKGLDRAIDYAKKWNAKLTIIHVVMPTGEEETDKFKSNLQKQVNKLNERLEELKISSDIKILKNDKLVEEIIIAQAKKVKADIIAVTAQTNNPSVLLGGSTTRFILRNSKLPTLIIKI